MKLRLFALRNSSTNKLVPELTFADKTAAKRARDDWNNRGESFVVTYGPDHRKFKP